MKSNIETIRPVIAEALRNPAGTCANSCEGNAFQIEIRRLNGRVEELEAERKAAQDQEPVAWTYDWHTPEGLIRDWVTSNQEEIPKHAVNIRPLYARSVPAEQPANARLMIQALTEESAEAGEFMGTHRVVSLEFAKRAIFEAHRAEAVLLDALESLEDACDRRAALLPNHEYLSQLTSPGVSDALAAVDDARRTARAAIAAHQAVPHPKAGPVRLTDEEIGSLERRARNSDERKGEKGPLTAGRAVEIASLRANGFPVEG